ncbi:hypothetical protein ABBQ32_006624 [Trebouxia sp. C0010 RCD-2024]
MMASSTTCCNVVHIPPYPMRHCCPFPDAPALYTQFLRHRQSSSWVLRVESRRLHRSCISRAAQATAFVSATSASLGSGVSFLFAASTLYCVPLYALMLFWPRRRVTVSVMHSNWIFVPLSIMYATLLLQSWTPDTVQLIMPGSLQAGLAGKFSPQFFPKLVGIQLLFSKTITAASLWVHLLSINLFAARTAYIQGLHDQVTSWHSVLLSMVFGPLGLLSHLATQGICASRRRQQPGYAT